MFTEKRYHRRARLCYYWRTFFAVPGHLAKEGLNWVAGRRRNRLAAAGDAHRWTVVDTYLPDARRVVCHRRRRIRHRYGEILTTNAVATTSAQRFFRS